MLTGPQLGAAIEAARLKKGVTKRALAAYFGVKAPSIQDWVKRGTIGKDRLPKLWAFFADVVAPEHWGMDAESLRQGAGQLSLRAPTVSLTTALETLQVAIANVAPEDKPELLDALAMWVKHGSQYLPAVLYVLQAPHRKQRRAA